MDTLEKDSAIGMMKAAGARSEGRGGQKVEKMVGRNCIKLFAAPDNIGPPISSLSPSVKSLCKWPLPKAYQIQLITGSFFFN